jgi:hypothetical protein
MASLLPENQVNRVSGSNIQVGQFRVPKCPKSDYRTQTRPDLTEGWKTKVWDVVEKEPHPSPTAVA